MSAPSNVLRRALLVLITVTSLGAWPVSLFAVVHQHKELLKVQHLLVHKRLAGWQAVARLHAQHGFSSSGQVQHSRRSSWLSTGAQHQQSHQRLHDDDVMPVGTQYQVGWASADAADQRGTLPLGNTHPSSKLPGLPDAVGHSADAARSSAAEPLEVVPGPGHSGTMKLRRNTAPQPPSAAAVPTQDRGGIRPRTATALSQHRLNTVQILAA